MTVQRTQVAIIGAGPAGLLLGRLLERQGIDTVIIEARSRAYCEARVRAGVLEQGTREVLIAAGVGERMLGEGIVHGGIYLGFDGERHHVPITELTGGSLVTVYGQTEVVKDLIAARVRSGAALHFDCSDVSIDSDLSAPVLRFVHEGVEHELHAEVLAGCDGFHGISRAAIPAGVLRTWDRVYPFSWLGVIAQAPPATDELIYARHERGFALYSMRSPEVSRLYIQVPPGTSAEAWSDDAIWDELDARLAAPGLTVNRGPIREKGVTPMRSFVTAPMRHENLFLAGDAAHIVPPTGAKGLNLAVGDVVVLADALCEHFLDGSDAGLESYSERCLGRIWRAQHFSWWMTSMLHLDPGDDAYGAELARSQLRYVVSSRAAATTLAENYVGLPLPVSLARWAAAPVHAGTLAG